MKSGKGSRFILVALAAIFFVVNISSPAIAQTTVDSYCTTRAAECAAIFGVQPAVAAPIVPASTGAVSVSAQVLSPTGQVLGTAFNGSFTPAANTASKILGLAGAAAMGGVATSAITSLQDKAKEKYCQANPTDSDCSGTWRVSGRGISTSCTDNGQTYSADFYGEPSFQTVSVVGCSGTGIYDASGARYGGDGYAYLNGTATKVQLSPTTEWKDWNQSKRDSATALLTPPDIASQITSSPLGGTSAITQILEFIKGNIRSQYTTIKQSNNGAPVTNSQFQTNFSLKIGIGGAEVNLSYHNTVNNSSTTINNNSSLDMSQTDNFFNNETVSLTQQIQNYINLVIQNNGDEPNPNPTPTPTPSPTPDTGTDKCPDVKFPEGSLPGEQEITPPNCVDKLTRPNFASYAIEKLSDRFPFDIVGSPADIQQASNECPEVTVWGKTKQICEVRQFLSAAKYPIWISFLVRCITSL